MRLMRGFGRFLIATLCGLVIAVGVHIAAILASPYLAEQDAFAKMQPTLTADKAQIVSAPGGENTWLPRPDPAVAVAACAFDLRNGPMRIASTDGNAPVSFSFHKESGGVFFAVTDRAAVRGRTRDRRHDRAPARRGARGGRRERSVPRCADRFARAAGLCDRARGRAHAEPAAAG